MSHGSRARAPEESTIDENMIDEKNPTGHEWTRTRRNPRERP
jgi:hypothetical protein